MSQAQWIILLFKIALIADAIAIVVFVVDYTRLAPWWRNPIGRTIVSKDCLLFIPIFLGGLSVFWHFNRTSSHIAAWLTVVSFGLIAPVMLWRTVVFELIHRQRQDDPEPREEKGI
jgi:hypothetical protein